MKRRVSPRTYRVTALCTLLTMVWIAAPTRAVAQQQATKQRSERRRTAGPLAATGDPFVALASEVAAGRGFTLKLRRTELDTKAEATAQVVQREQTLLVRMRARNLPLPSRFEVPRYALWVYIPNYEVRMYIGDLPVTLTRRSRRSSKSDRIRRGESDTAYRFTALPSGAVFGGLLLTAEPARYTPIINQALRPLLVGFTSGVNIGDSLVLTKGYNELPPASMK